MILCWTDLLEIRIAESRGRNVDLTQEDAMRKIIVPRKTSKNILVVADTPRMRSQMERIRELGHKCALAGNVGTAMAFLQDGERVHVVVVDLMSARSAEKLVRWVNANRPGVRTVCVNNESEAVCVPGILRRIFEPANPPEIIK